MDGELFTKAKKLTSSDIRAGMSARFAPPEWAIMWEVGEATGGAGGRYADAVMMSLWPSRGLELHGVEIKVSRSDWKREAADPRKAEAIAKFCDRWWIHTPTGVVGDLSSLPPAWGLREFDGKVWRTIREAAKTDAEPVSRGFLAAMLRRADTTMRALINDAMQEAREKQSAEAQARQARFDQEVSKAAERRTAELNEKAEALAKFEAVFGPGLLDRLYGKEPEAFARIARAFYETHLSSEYGGASEMVRKLRAAADKIDAAMSIVPTLEPQP